LTREQLSAFLSARFVEVRTPAAMHRYEGGLLPMAVRHLFPALVPGARVLDLGCGAGWLSDALAALGIAAVGIDVDPRRLRAPAKGAMPGAAGDSPVRAHRLAADASRLPFASGSFDAVISVSVLQYVDWRSTLGECRRVLKVGGRAAFIENLSGHPLARLYRLARRRFWPYGRHLKPHRHLPWQELDTFSDWFDVVDTRPHALLTPALAVGTVLPAMLGSVLRAPRERAGGGDRTGAGEGAGQLAFAVCEGLDAAVLRHVSVARRLAWLVGVMCVNKGASA
jgi:SAM-dependent methyltransferase